MGLEKQGFLNMIAKSLELVKGSPSKDKANQMISSAERKKKDITPKTPFLLEEKGCV